MDEDFVARTKEQIVDQQKQASEKRQEKLHDAGVLSRGGADAWVALRKEVNDYVNKIGTLRCSPTNEREFALLYNNETLHVTFEPQRALITFKGERGKGGTFTPTVEGEALIYTTWAGAPVTPEKIAESLIATLVEQR